MSLQHSARPKVIDIHSHVIVPAFFEEASTHSVFTGFGKLGAPALGRGPIVEVLSNQDLQREDMDKRGIDVSVVSLTTVLQPVTWGDARREREVCVVANDFVADWVARDSRRFRGAATLPLSDRDTTLAELDRCASELKMRTVQLPTQVNGVYLGEEPYHYLWEELARRDMVAFVHPDGVKDLWFQQYRMWNSIGQSIEEAKFLTIMIYEGVLESFPKLRLVMAHGGGFLPHYMGRLDRNVRNMPETNRNISKLPSEYMRQIYFDTCVYDVAILDALIGFAGVEHVVFGTDYPVGDADPVAVVSAANTLKGESLRKVLGGNIAGLLGESLL